MDHVTLQVTLKGGSLHVDDKQIPRGNRVKITWQLSVPDGSRGSFNAIGDPTHPGFSWAKSPTSGVFREDEITITDTNDSNSSCGEWAYQLCATIDGKPYSTGRPLNPKIKNL